MGNFCFKGSVSDTTSVSRTAFILETTSVQVQPPLQGQFLFQEIYFRNNTSDSRTVPVPETISVSRSASISEITSVSRPVSF
jgi:hypothetical protein